MSVDSSGTLPSAVPSSMVRANLELELSSTSAAVNEAVQLLLQLLSGCACSTGLKRMALALDEAVRNAYEHGNLAITSEEKVVLAANNALEDELRKRETVACEKGMKIHVVATVENTSFTCIITDDGDGFDWRKKLYEIEHAEADLTALSGRGVSLIHQLFDSVAYNEKGNEVTLKKSFA